MSAVISIVQNSGESYAGYSQETAKSIFYFLPIDSSTANKSNYPLQVPDAGTLYSFEAYLRCRCDLAPVTSCDNFKVWYDSGIPVTGYTITVNSDLVSAYEAPIDVLSSRGTRIDFITKNAEGNSIALTGSLVDVGDYTSYLVFQLEVVSTGALGNYNVDFIIQYDET